MNTSFAPAFADVAANNNAVRLFLGLFNEMWDKHDNLPEDDREFDTYYDAQPGRRDYLGVFFWGKFEERAVALAQSLGKEIDVAAYSLMMQGSINTEVMESMADFSFTPDGSYGFTLGVVLVACALYLEEVSENGEPEVEYQCGK